LLHWKQKKRGEQQRLMVKEFRVRYGRNYKVVLAIVLPCLLIVPFILIMQAFPFLEEWKIWTLIYAFLGCLILFSLWLVMRVYPSTILRIRNNEIDLSFNHRHFFSPTDFSFTVDDIITFHRKELGGDEYFMIETGNPRRKFQISASSNEEEDELSFNEAMYEISEMMGGRKI